MEDSESTNGTFVNDERIQQLALKPGDRVGAGRVELLVRGTNARNETDEYGPALAAHRRNGFPQRSLPIVVAP